LINIGKKTIDHDSPVYIIAEVGVNHNGSIELAKRLIDAAAEAGADAVKFQTFKSEKLVSKSALKADYQVKNTQNNESQLEMLKKLELSFDDFRLLKAYCEEKNIEFMSTPFDDESAKFLHEIGVHAFKIGSGDLTNIPFLRSIGKYDTPVLLSTGMGTLGEIEEALEVLSSNQVAVLHCTSNYPAPYEDVNLKVIETFKVAFGKIVGYSDHTEGNEISFAAVAMGAKIIEKHFTLDKDLPGPDHKASITPLELKQLVDGVRKIEVAYGNGIKRCMPSELNTKDVARKSLVAAQDMPVGTILTVDNLTIKRPGNGIPPKYYDKLLGKKIKKPVEQDQVLSWDDLI
jgi:N,N'-diacetyllegionaminate synthase